MFCRYKKEQSCLNIIPVCWTHGYQTWMFFRYNNKTILFETKFLSVELMVIKHECSSDTTKRQSCLKQNSYQLNPWLSKMHVLQTQQKDNLVWNKMSVELMVIKYECSSDTAKRQSYLKQSSCLWNSKLSKMHVLQIQQKDNLVWKIILVCWINGYQRCIFLRCKKGQCCLKHNSSLLNLLLSKILVPKIQ